MAIKGGQAANGIVIAATDTTLLNPISGRALITFASLHEQTGSEETLELFLSTDVTSAAGERVDILTLAGGEQDNPKSLAGLTVPSGSFLIGKATTGSRVEVNITYTQYTGSS